MDTWVILIIVVCAVLGFLLLRPKAAPAVVAQEPGTLDAEVARRTAEGWTVTSHGEHTVTFTRRGSADGLVAVLLLLLGVVPGVLYVLLARPTFTLAVTGRDGVLTRTSGRA